MKKIDANLTHFGDALCKEYIFSLIALGVQLDNSPRGAGVKSLSKEHSTSVIEGHIHYDMLKSGKMSLILNELGIECLLFKHAHQFQASMHLKAMNGEI